MSASTPPKICIGKQMSILDLKMIDWSAQVIQVGLRKVLQVRAIGQTDKYLIRLIKIRCTGIDLIKKKK